jgi:hypothetical protein
VGGLEGVEGRRESKTVGEARLLMSRVGDAALRAATMGLSGRPVIVGNFDLYSRSLLLYPDEGRHVPVRRDTSAKRSLLVLAVGHSA